MTVQRITFGCLRARWFPGLIFKGSIRIEFESSVTYVLKCEGRIRLSEASDCFVVRGTPLDDNSKTLNRIVGWHVSRSNVLEDGQLLISSTKEGRSLSYLTRNLKSWQLTGPDRFLIVSLPGGETALWSGDQN